MIFTVYNEKITKKIPELQKKVCDKFGVDLTQIKVDNWVSHGKSIDQVLNKIEDENEIITLLDIDVIPLNSDIIPNAIKWCKDNIGIYAAAQRAVNINGSKKHAAPAFMVFSIKTFNLLGRTSFETTYRSDCGGELTHIANEKNIQIKYLYPSHVERPDFVLEDDIKFGMGTTYEGGIYHAFESRFTKNDHFFIKKCLEILK
jgi:hypothetical protein